MKRSLWACEVMTWKRVRYYWPFVRGIDRPPVVSPHKGPVMRLCGVFFGVVLSNKHENCRWYDVIWHHCNGAWCLGCAELKRANALYLSTVPNIMMTSRYWHTSSITDHQTFRNPSISSSMCIVLYLHTDMYGHTQNWSTVIGWYPTA